MEEINALTGCFEHKFQEFASVLHTLIMHGLGAETHMHLELKPRMCILTMSARIPFHELESYDEGDEAVLYG